MVEILEIPIIADKKRIIRKIRTKAKMCGTPYHWVLREPVKSSELMWLRPKDVDKRRGTRVPVRRVLYFLEYGTLPLKQIHMACSEKLCINPAHMRIRGFEEEANAHIEKQIEKGWLYPDEAEELFGWTNKHNIKIPAGIECNLGSLGE